MRTTKFAVLGLGRFGSTLVKALSDEGMEVLAADWDLDNVEAVKDHASLAVSMDTTNRAALLEQGLDGVDVAIVGIGENFEANLLTSLLLKQIGVKRVISRAMNRLQAQILEGIGIEDVVSPEEESARRLARNLVRPNLLEFVELAEDHGIVQFEAPAAFAGRSIMDLDLRRRHNVNIVAIKRAEGRVVSVPKPDDVIGKEDILVVIGSERDIERIV